MTPEARHRGVAIVRWQFISELIGEYEGMEWLRDPKAITAISRIWRGGCDDFVGRELAARRKKPLGAPRSMYALMISSHGDLIETFDSREEARAAMEEMLRADPSLAEDIVVLEFWGRKMVGEVCRPARLHRGNLTVPKSYWRDDR